MYCPSVSLASVGLAVGVAVLVQSPLARSPSKNPRLLGRQALGGKTPRSRYVLVKRNLAGFRVFGVSRNQ
jgi:hypothetical protein